MAAELLLPIQRINSWFGSRVDQAHELSMCSGDGPVL